ncbi:MAG: ABC transporter ATP-binding protein [Saprospiraceae bacterium]|nr:ABC transporter ATP-binding protein [Saprospiraceae bacterium]
MKLKIENLTKTYPNGTKALDAVSIEINSGMFGLLGPNGAGKSTLMRTVATLQSPDAGTVTFNNINVLTEVMELRKVLGYLPQEFGVYPGISAERLLDYLAQLKGVSSKKERAKLIEKCLEITNLSEVRKVNVSSYSGGMKQRFGIAQLLLNAPSLIIVDEPTAGLDPAERQRFLNILREISRENIVIFSTHIVDDIKDLCTDMAILNHGRIFSHLTPQEAMNSLIGKIFTTQITESELHIYKSSYTVLSSNYNADHSLNVRVLSEAKPGESFLSVLPTLEDFYFATLNHKHV